MARPNQPLSLGEIEGEEETIPIEPLDRFLPQMKRIAAIKAGRPQDCYSRFAIGASLTEIMRLGCVSLRAGQKIEWDGPAMLATNCPAAAQFVKRDNRAGWVLS